MGENNDELDDYICKQKEPSEAESLKSEHVNKKSTNSMDIVGKWVFYMAILQFSSYRTYLFCESFVGQL